MALRRDRSRAARSVVALLTVLGTTAGAGSAGAVPGGAPRWTIVAPGVAYREFDLYAAGGTAHAHLLRVDLRDPRVRLGPLHGGFVAERTAVSRLADERGAVAGVNGDFFDIGDARRPDRPATGAGVGPMIAEGRPLKAAVPSGQRFGPAPPPGATGREVIGVGVDRRARVDRLELDGTVAARSETVPLGGLNQYALPVDSVGAFTTVWGTASRRRATCGDDTRRSAPCSADTHEVTVRGGRVVASSTTPGGGPIPPGTTVLVGRETGAERLRAMTPGGPVRVGYRLVASASRVPFRFALGGHPLMEDGRPVPGLDDRTSAVRTAVGLADGGRLVLLLVLDGAPRHRAGLTVAELADTLRALGAVDGFNLDGGGSSTLVTREPGAPRVSVRNTPSAGAERPVANGIGVFLAPSWA
ncbi:phosphodiester glycosidase family protein [Streptomyces sp. ZYX-F-203]